MNGNGVPVNPKKILVILHGSIGDVTRALPLAAILREGFPGASLSWSVEPPSMPLVENYPGVDEVIVFERGRWWSDIWTFLGRIRSARFDLVLDLQRHLKSGLISFWTGSRYRLGFNRRDCKEFNWVFNNQFIPASGDQISKLDHYLKFAEHLGLRTSPVAWRFAMRGEDQARVTKLLEGVRRPFAVLFVGSRWESKQWFPAQVAQCAREIYDHLQLEVIFLGGPNEHRLAELALHNATVPVTNLVDRTSLREAIGIIGRARVAVGPDTGLMHIAAAVGTPVVSLWGATDPLRSGPQGFADLVVRGQAACAPCNRRYCPIGRVCMQSIKPNTILSMVEKALEGTRIESVSRGGFG